MNKEKLKTKNTHVGADATYRPFYEGIPENVGVDAHIDPLCEEQTRTNVGAGLVPAQDPRGITLIALIITIIVLLILAGVAITLAVDSDGLFSKANQAGKEWNNAVVNEETELAGLMQMLNSIGGNGESGEQLTPPETPDTQAPTVPTGITKIEKLTSIEVTATGGTDEQSGVAGYQYSIDGNTWTATIVEGTSYTISNLEPGTTYTIYAKTIDQYGNESETLTITATTTITNEPSIPTGVKIEYVTWSQNNGTWTESLTSEEPEEWYNYENKQWANIKTTSATANEDGTYNSAYWVWIPRYAYKVPEKPTSTKNPDAPTFEIEFLKEATNTPVDDTFTATILPNTTESVSPGEWVVHPAFNFGGTQVSGIWVAKYEASSSNTSATYGGGNTTDLQVQVLPSVPSWRYITASNMFTVCRNMTASTGVLEGVTNSDPHMMKNVEWGAVVYLAQSEYGKKGQVWNNPYWDSTSSTILTGKASSAEDGANASTATDAATTTECDSYNEGNGPEASTTGNVYGVYDMAGGSWEYTAAYVNNDEAQESSYLTSLITAAGNNDTVKYVDIYEAAEEDTYQKNYEANANKYGDAVYETSYQGTGYTAWQNDYSFFPSSSSPLFMRGGGYLDGVNAGVFYFDYGNGGSYVACSFRPVCVAL